MTSWRAYVDVGNKISQLEFLRQVTRCLLKLDYHLQQQLQRNELEIIGQDMAGHQQKKIQKKAYLVSATKTHFPVPEMLCATSPKKF